MAAAEQNKSAVRGPDLERSRAKRSNIARGIINMRSISVGGGAERDPDLEDGRARNCRVRIAQMI